MIDDLRHYHAEDDPFVLFDEWTALAAFCALVLLGVIVLHLGAP